MNIFKRLSTLLKWIRICRNWHVIVLIRLGLYRRPVFTLYLRNGLALRLQNGGKRGEESDLVILGEIYFNEPYTRGDFKIRGKGDIAVVDIGGNVGIWATWAAAQAPSASIFIYEPHPQNFRLLQENIERNNLGTKIKFFHKAIAGKRGAVRLYEHSRGSGVHSLYPERIDVARPQFVEVEAITLSDVVYGNNLEKIDLLKLDCEGAEYDILLAAPQEILQKIRKIAMEYHPISGYSIDMLERFLRDHGFLVVKSEAESYLYAKQAE